MLGRTRVDLKLLGPLARGGVKNVLLFARRVEGRREAVLLSRQPALAGVVDLGGEAGGRGDVRGGVELDEGRPDEEAFDVQRGQRDEVRLLVARGRGDGEDGVSDLLNVDGLGEGGLLGIVTLEMNAGWEIGDAVGGSGWVMAVIARLSAREACREARRYAASPDLLAYELCGAGVILPLAQEQLAQERVQGLLLVAVLLAAGSVLLLQGGEEPLENQHGTLLRIGLLGGGGEDGGVLAPVGAVLGEGDAGEDERRCGQAGQVAVEGGDGLEAARA